MERFKDPHKIHGFVRAQLVAGARFALIMLQICHSKLDLTQVVAKVHEKVRRRRVGVDRINTNVSPVAEEMIEDLLRMDADFLQTVIMLIFLALLLKRAELPLITY
jgi:hypothetical protein